jgi:hypothetical protein
MEEGAFKRRGKNRIKNIVIKSSFVSKENQYLLPQDFLAVINFFLSMTNLHAHADPV